MIWAIAGIWQWASGSKARPALEPDQLRPPAGQENGWIPVIERNSLTAIAETMLAAGGLSETGQEVAEAIEARLRTGRPLAADEWIEGKGRIDRPAHETAKTRTQGKRARGVGEW